MCAKHVCRLGAAFGPSERRPSHDAVTEGEVSRPAEPVARVGISRLTSLAHRQEHSKIKEATKMIIRIPCAESIAHTSWHTCSVRTTYPSPSPYCTVECSLYAYVFVREVMHGVRGTVGGLWRAKEQNPILEVSPPHRISPSLEASSVAGKCRGPRVLRIGT